MSCDVAVRRECGAHRAYSTFRTALELLEVGAHKIPKINLRRRRSSLELFSQNKSGDNTGAEEVTDVAK